MDEALLLYVAIGVFALTVIGLVLTVYEFRTHIIADEQKPETVQTPPHRNTTGHGSNR